MNNQNKICAYISHDTFNQLKNEPEFQQVATYPANLYHDSTNEEVGMIFSRIGRIHFYVQTPNKIENIKYTMIHLLKNLWTDNFRNEALTHQVTEMIQYLERQ